MNQHAFLLQALNPKVLAIHTGHDLELAQEFLARFKASLRSDGEEIIVAVAENSMQRVSDAAERLFAASKIIGADGLRVICSVLHTAASAQDAQTVSVLVDRFVTEAQRTDRAIDGLLA